MKKEFFPGWLLMAARAFKTIGLKPLIIGFLGALVVAPHVG